MNKRWQLACLSLAFLSNFSFLSAARGIINSEITVTIDGLKNLRGQICLSIFDSSQGFPSNSDRAIRGQCLKVSQNKITAIFRDLPAGTYAVAVIHDANNDSSLNTNALGIPTEGFGFSRNPQILTGPPNFGDSAIFVAGQNTAIEIKLKYF
jgi:uncharacterized protein (DUF2141 family)